MFWEGIKKRILFAVEMIILEKLTGNYLVKRWMENIQKRIKKKITKLTEFFKATVKENHIENPAKFQLK